MTKIIARISVFMGLVSLSFIFTPSFGQSTEKIAQIIKDGSSKELAQYLHHTVSLNIDNATGDYSKKQAEVILRDFFRKSPPQDFTVVHEGESADNIWYLIGNYTYNDGVLKVLVKGRTDNGNMSIYSLDFTKQ